MWVMRVIRVMRVVRVKRVLRVIFPEGYSSAILIL